MNSNKIVFVILIFLMSSGFLYPQVNTEIYRRDKDKEGFEGSLNFSYSNYKGNTEFTMIKGGFRLDHLKGNYNTFLIGNIDYGRKDDGVYLSKGFSHLRTIRRLNQTLSIELFTQKQYNKFLYLKDRHLLGSGLRISSFFEGKTEESSNKLNLNVGIGLMYEREKMGADEDEPEFHISENTYLIRSTNYISLNMLLNDKLSLNMIAYYQVDTGNFSDYRLLLESTLQIELIKKLAFFINSNFRYDNEPFYDLKRYDFELTNGLIYRF